MNCGIICKKSPTLSLLSKLNWNMDTRQSQLWHCQNRIEMWTHNHLSYRMIFSSWHRIMALLIVDFDPGYWQQIPKKKVPLGVFCKGVNVCVVPRFPALMDLTVPNTTKCLLCYCIYNHTTKDLTWIEVKQSRVGRRWVESQLCRRLERVKLCTKVEEVGNRRNSTRAYVETCEDTKSPWKEKKQRYTATVQYSRSPDVKERACFQKNKLQGGSKTTSEDVVLVRMRSFLEFVELVPTNA
jgi:hypothetical protein